jgi:hypothetical protein
MAKVLLIWREGCSAGKTMRSRWNGVSEAPKARSVAP